MTDDIGPGDVVECTKAIQNDLPHYIIRPGDRAIVEEVLRDIPNAQRACRVCGNDKHGFRLVEYPTPPPWIWCPCSWRKIGGSKADTLARFNEYTRKRDDEEIRRVAKPFTEGPVRIDARQREIARLQQRYAKLRVLRRPLEPKPRAPRR